MNSSSSSLLTVMFVAMLRAMLMTI
jgi:hypothetical protein